MAKNGIQSSLNWSFPRAQVGEASLSLRIRSVSDHCYLGQVFIWLNLYDIRLMSPTSLSILVIPVVASDLQFKCTQLNHDTGIRKFAYFCYSIFDPKTLVPLPILIDSPRFFEYEYLNQAHFSLTL